MGNANEELLHMLKNSDDDFGLSSGTDLGEGDSGLIYHFPCGY